MSDDRPANYDPNLEDEIDYGPMTVTAPTRGSMTPAPIGMTPEAIGKAFVASGMFPDIKSEAQAIVKIIAGQEFGIGPMAAMTGINMIQGKPTLSANLLASAVKRHPRYDYRVKDHTDKGCSIEFLQDGKVVGVSKFDAEDAAKANLTGNNWRQYPRAMMFARALTQGVRWHCPDAIGGAAAYVPEELGAAVDEEGEPIQAEVVEDEPQLAIPSSGADVDLPACARHVSIDLLDQALDAIKAGGESAEYEQYVEVATEAKENGWAKYAGAVLNALGVARLQEVPGGKALDAVNDIFSSYSPKSDLERFEESAEGEAYGLSEEDTE